MNRTVVLILLLCFSFFGLSLGQVMSFPANQVNVESRPETDFILDGFFNDKVYENTEFIPFNPILYPEPGYTLLEQKSWDGSNTDISGEFAFFWDSRYFYIALKYYDDFHYSYYADNKSKSFMWMDDGFEIFVNKFWEDIVADGTSPYIGFEGNSVQLLQPFSGEYNSSTFGSLQIKGAGDGDTRIWITGEAVERETQYDIKAPFRSADGRNFTVEVQFPWDRLPGGSIAIAPGHIVAVSLKLTDIDVDASTVENPRVEALEMSFTGYNPNSNGSPSAEQCWFQASLAGTQSSIVYQGVNMQLNKKTGFTPVYDIFGRMVVSNTKAYTGVNINMAGHKFIQLK